MTVASQKDILAYRDEFPQFTNQTNLNSCSLGPLSTRAIEANNLFQQQWIEFGGQVWFIKGGWFDTLMQVRHRFAQLIGASIEEVALAPSVSHGLSAISSILDATERKKVVVSDMEFPTMAYQWLAKKPLGIECQFVNSPDHIQVPLELFENVLDDRTALVATSRVSFSSGYLQDVGSLAKIAHQHGAYLLVDDYQATGQIDIDVHALDIDFLVTGSLKWLLGGPGLAFIYVRQGLIDKLKPTNVGWFGNQEQLQLDPRNFVFRPEATRLEVGTPDMAAVYKANAALELLLDVGMLRIGMRTQKLSRELFDRATERGWGVRASTDPKRRSAIICLDLPGRPAVAPLVQGLSDRGIIIDARAGALRIAPHFFNTIEEIERTLDAIADLMHK